MVSARQSTVDFSGFRMPAEFEPHVCTWLFWPTRPDNWRENACYAQQAIRKLVIEISKFEPVVLVSPSALDGFRDNDVSLATFPYDDVWVRDTGPTILVSPDGDRIAINWKFNSWGGLFDNFYDDNRVATNIARYHDFKVINAPIVMEGGAILSDGKGTLFATEESILNENRNPGLSRVEAEAILRKYLNVEQVVWLPKGLAFDEAGGHIDNVLSLAPGNKILLSMTEDSSSPHFEAAAEAHRILADVRDVDGKSFQIIKLPIPAIEPVTVEEARGFVSPDGTINRVEGALLCASYANFYPCNGAVFVPTFDQVSDLDALDIVASAFPGRTVRPCHSREFQLGGGAIHCLTQHIPAKHRDWSSK